MSNVRATQSSFENLPDDILASTEDILSPTTLATTEHISHYMNFFSRNYMNRPDYLNTLSKNRLLTLGINYEEIAITIIQHDMLLDKLGRFDHEKIKQVLELDGIGIKALQQITAKHSGQQLQDLCNHWKNSTKFAAALNVRKIEISERLSVYAAQEVFAPPTNNLSSNSW